MPPPTPDPALHPDDERRIHAGGLSFPALDPPWRPAPPYLDLDDEVGQELVVAESGRGPYVACVFIGALAIDDPTLSFEREVASVVLVDLGGSPAGVLYASLPAVEPVPSIRTVLSMLRLG